MTRLEKFLDIINFRKALKIYLAISIVLVMVCTAAIAYIVRDKIALTLDYEKVSESFENNGFDENLMTNLNKLATDSKDIINVIAVDKNNNIIYKSNNSAINNSNNKFILIPYELNKRYLQDNMNKDIIYKVVAEDNILIDRDYITNNEKIVSDIDNDFYYEQDLGTQKIDLLNYMINRDSGEKIFIIRTAAPIPYVRTMLKVLSGILGMIFIIYWIGLALWVYKDANKKNINPGLWGLMVLIINLIGLIIYTIYKQNSKVCHKCGKLNNKDIIYCTSCGTKINDTCDNCGSIIDKNNSFCGNCGKKL